MNPDWFSIYVLETLEALVRIPVERWLGVIKKNIIETILEDALVRE